MVKWLYGLIMFLITDNRGEVDGGTGDDNGGGDPDPDNLSDPDADKGPKGDGADPGADPDKVDPSDIFGGDYQKAVKSYKELSSIHKPIEMKLAALNKTLEGMGVKVTDDGKLVVDESKAKAAEGKQRRFTEEHSGKLHAFFDKPESGKQFIESLKLLIQDIFDDGIDGERQKYTQVANFRKAEAETEKFIAKVYPDADPSAENFPEGGTPLYNRATEIYEANEDYHKHPKGQLFAVHEAAIELGIQPKVIAKAKEQGRKEGQESKRILSRVGGGEGGRSGGAGSSDVSSVDFITMTPTQRKEYQEKEFKKRIGGK